jgi:hypothetical protein
VRASVRAFLGATVLAVVATASAATALGSGSEVSLGTVSVDAPTAPAGLATHRSSGTLPSGTTAGVDPAVLAAMQAAGDDAPQSVVQTIELTVVGGALDLVDETASVRLTRVPGTDRRWTGELPPVRVIDARGTHAGWTVRWRVADASVDGATRRVRVDPGDPVVVAGLPEGLHAGSAGPAGSWRGRTLFEARRGYGGGTYEAGGTVTLRLPRAVDADEIVVELAFSVA